MNKEMQSFSFNPNTRENKMLKRMSDTEIAVRVVPTSVRWPDTSSTTWDKLRACVKSLRGVLRALDNDCAAVETSTDLSAQGVERRRQEVAQKALSQLAAYAPLIAAERAAASDLSGLEEKMGKLSAPPADVADALLAAEMRAHVAKQNSPLEFAMKSMSDARVLGALLHAPAFLSGLTDDQLNAIRHRAREAAHPAEAESHRWLKKALEEVRSGVEAAKRAECTTMRLGLPAMRL